VRAVNPSNDRLTTPAGTGSNGPVIDGDTEDGRIRMVTG
jgi:hypothetical protein